MEISAKDNASVKLFNLLKKSKKDRYELGQFTVEGTNLCSEALKENIEISVFFAEKSVLEKEKDLFEKIREKSEKTYIINSKLSSYMSDTKTPQGLFAICKMTKNQEITEAFSSLGNIIILENIQDPGNMGTIIRTADAMGIDLIAVSGDSADIYSPKVLRATTGSVFRQKIVIIENLCKAIEKLNESGFSTYAAALDKDSKILGEFNFKYPCAVVIGNEGNGLTKEVKELCTDKIIIPINEHTESLNAGLAAGILMWEMSKQR